MVHAVLVEDDDTTREFLVRSLSDEFSRKSEQVMIETYADGMGFLRTVGDAYHYDVLFLDIEMPGMDGLALAKRIRATMPYALLVFVSGKDQWVFRTFEVQPFRFIRKEDFATELPKLVSDLLQAIRSNNRHTIYLTEPASGDIYSFDVNALLYVEARRKECRVVTDATETMLRCPLRSMKGQLEPWNFIQCHRSYLVNWRAIYRIGKTGIRLTNGEEIPLSRGSKERVQQEFMRIVEREGI